MRTRTKPNTRRSKRKELSAQELVQAQGGGLGHLLHEAEHVAEVGGGLALATAGVAACSVPGGWVAGIPMVIGGAALVDKGAGIGGSSSAAGAARGSRRGRRA